MTTTTPRVSLTLVASRVTITGPTMKTASSTTASSEYAVCRAG